MRFFISFLVILISFSTFSQNLVLNGSFEDSEKCAEDLQQFDKNVKHWNTPTAGSTDLFNECATFEDLQPLNNYQGKQAPSDGQNYAGCYFYGIDDYREYIQGSLSESLSSDARYRLSFKISLADKSDMAIKEIQVMFTDSIIKSWGTYPINGKRIRNKKTKYFAVELISDDYYNDKEQWIEVSTEFIARVPANYFTIGNFKSNKNTNKKKTKFIPRIKKAYYFIDDVIITKINEPDTVTSSLITENENTKTNEELKLNIKYKLKNVRFEFDSTRLVPDSVSELDEIVRFLKQNSTVIVQIEGHTDNYGSEAYNYQLSTDRAFAIKQYLVKQGIEEKRIAHKGYGETKPINSNDSDDARSENRRVEFILTKM